MNVGEYVRTREGTIAKIKSKKDYTHGDYSGGENDFFLNVNHSYQDYDRIIKSSPQIIDLIEENDYVNGQKVRYIEIGEDYRYLAVDEDYKYIIAGYDKDGFTRPIRTVITHEQMKAMQYRVEE